MKVQPVTNHLLDCLSIGQRRWFMAHSTPVELVFGQVLCMADAPLKYVYFPVTGFISLLVSVVDKRTLEMGLIGSEGMLGATLALGNKNSPMQAMVQGTGKGLRMDAGLFLKQLKSNSRLRTIIHSYLYVSIQQLAQSGVCNSFHDVQQRLARWMLMTQDRAHSNHLQLTHQFLATMLGVRRSAVTIAAGVLQYQGLVNYSRGHIRVLNRAGLEAVACSCYQAAIMMYQNNIK